jgi:hypothetical protein
MISGQRILTEPNTFKTGLESHLQTYCQFYPGHQDACNLQIEDASDGMEYNIWMELDQDTYLLDKIVNRPEFHWTVKKS